MTRVALIAAAVLAALPRVVHGEDARDARWDPARAAAYHRVMENHVSLVVAKLAKRGQTLRGDGFPSFPQGDGLCLPCHTMHPGTPRSLTPIHITMLRGMEPGLTPDAPKSIRQPLCVDCHAYPLKNPDVIKGDIAFDVLRRPCLQPQCHTRRDRGFKWALTFTGHMKQAIQTVPNDELFRSNTRYRAGPATVNAGINRSGLKSVAVLVQWLLVAALAAAVWRRASRNARAEEPADE